MFHSGNQVKEKQLATQAVLQQPQPSTAKNNDQETQSFSESEPKTVNGNKQAESASAPNVESVKENNNIPQPSATTTAAALAVHRFEEKQTAAGEKVENTTISKESATENDDTENDVTSKGKTAAILAVHHFGVTKKPLAEQQNSEASGDITGEKQEEKIKEEVSQSSQDTASIFTPAVSIHRFEDTHGPSTQHEDLNGQESVSQDGVSSGVEVKDSKASASGDAQSLLTVNKGELLSQLNTVTATSGSGTNQDIAASGSDQVGADENSDEDLMKTAVQDVHGDSDDLATLEDYDNNFGFQFHGDPASGETEADADFLSSFSGSGDLQGATFPKDVIPRDPVYEFSYKGDSEDGDFENFENGRRSEIAAQLESISESASRKDIGGLSPRNNVPRVPLFEFPYNDDDSDLPSRNFEISRRSEIATHEELSSGSGEQIDSSSGLSSDEGLKSPKISGNSGKKADDEMDDAMNSKQTSGLESDTEAAMNSQTTGVQESAGDNMSSDTTSKGEGDSNDEEMSEINDDQLASGQDSMNEESTVISSVGSGDIVKSNSPKESNLAKPVEDTSLAPNVGAVEKLNSNPLKELNKQVKTLTHTDEAGSGSGIEDSSGEAENAFIKSEIHSGKSSSIEDAVFEVGSPLNVDPSGSGSDDSTEHTAKSVSAENKSAKARLTLMEKLMKARRVKAFRISHPEIQVPGDVTNRGVVPKSDSGK